MRYELSTLACPRCRAALTQPDQAVALACVNCAEAYPLLEGELPVLIPSPRQFLARSWLLYDRFIRQQLEELGKLSDSLSTQLVRMPFINVFQVAARRNLGLVRALQDAMRPHLDLEAISEAAMEEPRETTESSYFTSLSYLRRDWAGAPKEEAEIATLRDPLFDLISTHCDERATVLVPGAGTGRFAWELSALFDRVITVEISLGMAHQLHRVLQSDLEFFELNTRNLRNVTDVTRKHTASLNAITPAADTGRKRGSLTCLVGDAQTLPLPDKSVSAIVSVYFTDVLPLRRLLPELKRVLRPGGCFIHLGPLEYHFLDLRDSLAADELRGAFEYNGFTTLHESWHVSSHLDGSASMSTRRFDNWLFLARLKEVPESSLPAQLGPDTVLKFTGPASFETRGVLSPNGTVKEETSLVVASGARFDGAETVLDILREIDGERTIAEVIDALSEKYDIPDAAARGAIVRTLRVLVERGGLRVAD